MMFTSLLSKPFGCNVVRSFGLLGVLVCMAVPTLSADEGPLPLIEPTLQREFWTEQIEQPLEISAELPIADWPVAIAEFFDVDHAVDVIIDNRALNLADVDPKQPVAIQGGRQSTRNVLRTALSPLGLRAVVTDEGLLITADMAELTRRGISTDRWIGLDESFTDRVESVLDKEISVEFAQLPLSEAIRTLGEETHLAIEIDSVALRDNGLTTDEPVDATADGQSTVSVLDQILQPLNLQLTMRPQRLIVTTPEGAEGQLLYRIYYLDGVIEHRGYHSLIQLIQTTLHPDAWESLGGNSTMCGYPSGNRPALAIATTLDVHRDIASLLQRLRADSIADPDGQTLPDPRVNPPGGMFGVGGFGAGFGGGPVTNGGVSGFDPQPSH